MSKKNRSQSPWKNGEIPNIPRHSLCKHDILKDYLIEYIGVRARKLLGFADGVFNLTIVDGFAGGGRYVYEGKRRPGSPIVIVQAINEAVSSFVSIHGENRVRFNIDIICIEQDTDAMESLKYVVGQEKYQHGEIIPWKGSFGDLLPHAIKYIKTKTNRNGKCIFFLDQFGYSDVSMKQLNTILCNTNSEIILTFAVDALTTFFTKPERLPVLSGLNLSDEKVKSLIELANIQGNYKPAIECILSKHIEKCSGAKNFTPFFIHSQVSNWGYWLVHLSNHYKARSVMVDSHWKYGNKLVHYGGPGLNMLGHDPHDAKHYGQAMFGAEYRFDEQARNESMESLPYDITKLIYDSGERSMLVSDLFSGIYNQTPARMEMVKEAIWISAEDKQISIRNRKRETIKDGDMLTIPRQSSFMFLKRGKK